MRIRKEMLQQQTRTQSNETIVFMSARLWFLYNEMIERESFSINATKVHTKEEDIALPPPCHACARWIPSSKLISPESVPSCAFLAAKDDISRLPNNKWKRTFQLGGSRFSQRDALSPAVGDHPNEPRWLPGTRRSSSGSGGLTAYTRTSCYKEACSWRMRTLCALGVRCLLLVRRNLDPYGSFTAFLCSIYLPFFREDITPGFRSVINKKTPGLWYKFNSLREFSIKWEM